MSRLKPLGPKTTTLGDGVKRRWLPTTAAGLLSAAFVVVLRLPQMSDTAIL